MTLEGRIKRLERQWDHPVNLGPDPETVELWASLWTAVGIEESRAKDAPWSFWNTARLWGRRRHSDTARAV